jgi:dTDP-4-amino-4,6-dideoxygalactose transaminase
LFGYKEGDFPESELVSKSALSLPMFPELKKEEVECVCGKVHEFFDQKT